MLHMFGRKVVYVMGSRANEIFFNAREEDFSAQNAYASLTVPVFGEGVVYDVPNSVLVEQKKMIKGGLTTEVFNSYVPLMVEEVEHYFKRWGNEGEADLLQTISEVTIMTASRCLMGEEIRSVLDEKGTCTKFLAAPADAVLAQWPTCTRTLTAASRPSTFCSPACRFPPTAAATLRTPRCATFSSASSASASLTATRYAILCIFMQFMPFKCVLTTFFCLLGAH